MAPSKRAIARAIARAGNKPTAPVDAPGATGYDHLIANAAEAIQTRNNNRRNP